MLQSAYDESPLSSDYIFSLVSDLNLFIWELITLGNAPVVLKTAQDT
jgi:hypothetical protein